MGAGSKDSQVVFTGEERNKNTFAEYNGKIAT
jgi:hypothetical protein